MILVVESGATKCDWCLCDRGCEPIKYKTAGINVAVMDEVVISSIVGEFASGLDLHVREGVETVHFYGAGLVGGKESEGLLTVLKSFFPKATVEFASDLIAAARALFGDEPGVAAIMGTGSNSCMYDGEKVVGNYRAGGFILGDEGSGAVLGKLFLSDYFKGLVSEPVAEEFDREFGLDYITAVQNVYKGQAPSRYLASFAPFIVSHKEDPYVEALMRRNFRDFIERSLSRYECKKVGIVGTFGAVCKDMIAQIGEEYGLEFVGFLASPLERLVEYHLA